MEFDHENFAMLIDRRGWCFDRTALALQKYHNTKKGWKTYCAIEPDGKVIQEVNNHQLYRVGGMSLTSWFLAKRLISLKGAVLVPTLASFVDAFKLRSEMTGFLPHIRAFIINDQRMIHDVVPWNKPVIYSPDKVDHEVFYPKVGLRPEEGPLRLGWAGSRKYWNGVKHVSSLEQLVKATDGLEWVRQDRELDGQKDADEMCDWFNGLDAYICINDKLTCTPVPVLEALACGIPTLTTRCGELWPLIESHHPEWIIETHEAKDVQRVLNNVRDLGRDQLQQDGLELMHRIINFISWKSGEAERITKAFGAMIGATL